MARKTAYVVMGTELGYRRDLSQFMCTRKLAKRKLSEIKEIPVSKQKIIKNLRVKKVRLKKWQRCVRR